MINICAELLKLYFTKFYLLFFCNQFYEKSEVVGDER